MSPSFFLMVRLLQGFYQMKILFSLVKYNNQSKEAIMKKNDLAKTLSEYIKEDTNIKFDFSGEVSSTYSVLCAEKLISNFNYNKPGSIHEIYDYEKDDEILVNTQKAITKEYKNFNELSDGIKYIDTKKSDMTFEEINNDFKKLQKNLINFSTDFHHSLDKLKKSKPQQFNKEPLALVSACMHFWCVDCKRTYPKFLSSGTELDKFLRRIFEFFDMSKDLSLEGVYSNWVKVFDSNKQLKDWLKKKYK